MDARYYSGCASLSNNSAELSAIPQILVRILMWRKRRLAELQQMAEAGRAAGLHDEAGAIDAIEDPERPTTLVLVLLRLPVHTRHVRRWRRHAAIPEKHDGGDALPPTATRGSRPRCESDLGEGPRTL